MPLAPLLALALAAAQEPPAHDDHDAHAPPPPAPVAVEDAPGEHDAHGAPEEAHTAHDPHGAHDAHAGHAMPPLPLGLPMNRIGSGTSWLPDSTPMYGLMAGTDRLTVMYHQNVFLTAIGQAGPRGGFHVGSINWFMGMVRADVLGGQLGGRLMMSLEPFTVGADGYPLLLQTGEGLVDAQHPHDLFMELALEYRIALSRGLGLQLYGGFAGEPALGPSAYPHRVSAMANPLAPLTHHWLDATHIVFGVLTAGVYTPHLMVELSVFNGREPSAEGRLDIEVAPWDSLSGRVTVAPHPDWTAQVSVARLVEPEEGVPGNVIRPTASVSHNRRLGPLGRGNVASLLAGAVNVEPEHTTGALLFESAWDPAGPSLLFGRAEVVGKSEDELRLAGGHEDEHGDDHHDAVHTVGGLTLGYVYELPLPAALVFGVGGQANMGIVPSALADVYGGRVVGGGAFFLRLRPVEMGGAGRDPAWRRARGDGLVGPAAR